MINNNQTDFEQLVKDSGIPTTEAEIKTEWETEAVNAEITINNNSVYSPFWRIVTALITKATHWLIQSLTNHLLPNTFIKTASGTFLDILAWGVDVVRKPAIKTQGQITFNRSDTVGVLIIPAGTAIQSAEINSKIYSLLTETEISFPDGESQITVLVEAAEEGADYNLATGFYSILPIPIAGVDSVVNADNWILVFGADAEIDDELRLRCKNQFSALNQYHTNSVYLAMITEFSGVNVGNVYFVNDAPRGAGTADAYIMFEIGNPSVAFLTSIEDSIMGAGNHGHGDDLKFFPVEEIDYAIICSISVSSFLTPTAASTLQANVEQFIRAAFRENNSYTPTLTNPYSLFSFSRLASELHEQFDDLVSVTFTNSNITSLLDIPRASSVAVTLS